MILYPAIDLKDGQAVRLFKGDFARMTVFDTNPADRAARFEAMGFAYLHIVDLDGALKGAGANLDAIAAIRARTRLPMQLGGGIRDLAAIEKALTLGVNRVILGTIAAKNPPFVREAAKAFPGQVAVGIDAIDGMVAVEGWLETTNVTALDLARQFEDVGVAALIVTDVGRDGTKIGINIDFTGAIADAVGVDVIASGGLKGVEDIVALKARPGRPVAGAILGRALYDGLIDAAEALRIAA
ncbi:1-(5-phosphoribosyl)-5-[(5-phosphoribosylamino) methylideneamino] imidazole-4-carboxamide isomerase [Candidatus Phycosocius bacilliformis]|uniref:1-(5-phosphoribosyl)-5-[(5-phosphoribosylamino)methylideneamino] imidazole-4-carboxamide isomerase n=1 Tax=Candidatus Phycosocius bacilliformis TaxID=1445552 RepID=A0A2P2EDZ4_9PROT|nr:1-(5-phosphoribosyl)-5-[(5-phosphoribosylamino)methylideneamino]imidazole-4-carboxamide isomerase [Candidatus Phycosocius bacilliformis]GBF59280.1 1-(5-phosphoribosyl)-5-[(5-phosphoribosylamino) methylideneamino] imidazole-4-carboxamide isomerase [Candidatus Phycosocius bacilliformis]